MIRIFDFATGKVSYTLNGKNVTNMKFSPDSRTLEFMSPHVVCGNRRFKRLKFIYRAQIWSLELKKYNSGINGFTFSPNCHLMARICDNGKIKIQDLIEGKTRRLPDSHGLYIDGLKFSSNNHLVTFGRGDTTIKLWDSITGALRHSFEGHAKGVITVAFSRDNHLMAAATPNMIRLWDLVTKTRLNMLKADHDTLIVALQFSPMGRFLAIAYRPRSIQIWDLAAKRMRYKLPAYMGYNEPMAFCSSGQLMTFDDKGFTIQIWDFTTETMQRRSTHEGLHGNLEVVPFQSCITL